MAPFCGAPPGFTCGKFAANSTNRLPCRRGRRYHARWQLDSCADATACTLCKPPPHASDSNAARNPEGMQQANPGPRQGLRQQACPCSVPYTHSRTEECACCSAWQRTLRLRPAMQKAQTSLHSGPNTTHARHTVRAADDAHCTLARVQSCRCSRAAGLRDVGIRAARDRFECLDNLTAAALQVSHPCVSVCRTCHRPECMIPPSHRPL